MHYDKYAEPAEAIFVAGQTLKWYNLAKSGESSPVEIHETARSFLAQEDAAGNI